MKFQSRCKSPHKCSTLKNPDLYTDICHFVPVFYSVRLNGSLKGTVRPDWICMRVVSLESPLKAHQPLYVLNFLFWILNIWKDFKVLSRFMQKWIQPPAFSITVCIESCLPIGWHTFIWWKNPPKSFSIFVWIVEWWNSLPSNRNPKNNWYLSRIYGVRFGEKDRGLSTCKPWSEQAGGLDSILHEAAQDFEVF